MFMQFIMLIIFSFLQWFRVHMLLPTLLKLSLNHFTFYQSRLSLCTLASLTWLDFNMRSIRRHYQYFILGMPFAWRWAIFLNYFHSSSGFKVCHINLTYINWSVNGGPWRIYNRGLFLFKFGFLQSYYWLMIIFFSVLKTIENWEVVLIIIILVATLIFGF